MLSHLVVLACVLGYAQAYPAQDVVSQVEGLAKDSRGLADNTAKVAKEIEDTLKETEKEMVSKEEEKKKSEQEMKESQRALEQVITQKNKKAEQEIAAAMAKKRRSYQWYGFQTAH